MKRRNLLGAFAAAGALMRLPDAAATACCTIAAARRRSQHAKDKPPGAAAFKDVGSKLRITNMRVFGVTLDERIAQADRPYVFVKIETNQGVVGWGEATLEGKAAAAMACVMDLKDLIIGSDPDAGGASLPAHVHRQLLPRRSRAGIGDLRNRPGAVGHTRQGHEHAGV